MISNRILDFMSFAAHLGEVGNSGIMSLSDDVARYYAERALVYDQTAGYTDPQSELLRIPIKARYQALFKDLTVLEIACGTGYWTAVVAQTARSVLAIDIHPSLISQAQHRCRNLPNVTFRVADAFRLDGVPGGFNAAFGIWWWSHVPRDRFAGFLHIFHGKLNPGALVLFSDLMPEPGIERRVDAGGNTIEHRVLPDGRSYEIVKNDPEEQEIRNVLAGFAESIEYVRCQESWSVVFRVMK